MDREITMAEDSCATDLPDLAGAGGHAAQIARELMRNNEPTARCWQLDVRDEHGALVFELPFTAVDRSVEGLSPNTLLLIEDLTRKRQALAEAISTARWIVLE